MVNRKSTAPAPAWLKQPPSNTELKLIKNKSYDYLKDLAVSGAPLESSTAEIPDYLQHLGDWNTKFADIKAAHIKTTFKFIEVIRTEIRHQIDKIHKEIDDGEIVVLKPQEGSQDGYDEDVAKDATPGKSYVKN